MTSAQGYKKIACRSLMTGDWFEVKMSALIYLRSRARYRSESLRHFKLATNVDDTGAFDDIVYSVVLADNTTYTILMQLKHKERAHLGIDTFASESGDFSLKKYLKSFMGVKKSKYKDDSKNKFLLDGPFENFQFVIFTTAPLKKKDKIVSKVTYVTEGYLENLLMTNIGQQLIYKFERDTCEEVLSLAAGEDHTQPDAEEFLQKLIVYSGQKPESELDALIKKELISICSEAVGKEEPLYRILEGYFKKWWRDDKGEILDENCDILQRALIQLSFEIELIKQTKNCTLDVKFDQTIPEDICINFFEDVSLLHIVSTGRSLRLTATKTLQFLHTQQVSFTFVSLEYLLLNSISIISDWEEGYKDCLTVMVDSAVTYELLSVKNIGEIIQKILKKNSLKKFIILSRSNCKITDDLINCISKNNIKTFRDKFDFSHLQTRSQEEIFTKKVLFKNEKIELQFLFDKESLKKLLTDDLLEDLLSKGNVKIEGRLPVVIPHFIPRRLRRDILEQDIFKPNTSMEVLAVSGVTLDELQQLVDKNNTDNEDPLNDRTSSGGDEEMGRSRLTASNKTRVGFARDAADRTTFQFLVLSTSRAHEEYEMTVRVRHNVHWICMENNTLYWITSSENRTAVEKYESHIVLDEEVLSKQDSRVAIILGEPGMGKSTIIPRLAQTWKIRNPNDITVEINLSQHFKLLAELPGAFNFLIASLGISSSLDKSYIKTCLEVTGNIIVLIDSFDEACPLYQNEACNLLRDLLATKAKKIFVTSRPCMEDVLKVHLVSSPYNLVEFSVDEQRDFFVKYFEKTSRPTHVKDVITKIMHSLQAIDPAGRLLGIPLQTFMIAEIFDDYMRDPSNNEFPDHLDIIRLFEKFIGIKFKIFFSKNKDMTCTQEELKASFLENHTYASFLALFSEHDVERIVTDAKIADRAMVFFSRIEEGRDSSGLVSRVIDNKPIFIHQTFAEYFVALWFAEHYKSNRHFLIDNLFKSNINVIRLMFDRILAKGHILHEAVLNRDMVQIEMLLSKALVDVRSKDNGGRSPVHLASALGFYSRPCVVVKSWSYAIVDTRFIGPRERHVIELLLEHGGSADKRDNVFEWTPLEYAIKTKTWDAGEYLLARRARSDRVSKSQGLLPCDVEHTNVLFVHELKNFINLFLDNGLIVDEALHFNTMLRNACLVGNIGIVDTLLKKIEYTANRKLLCCWLRHARVRRCIASANDVGDSAFSLACECKHSHIVQHLLSYGADIYARNIDGNTCIHFACISGALSVVNVLIDDVEQRRDSVERFINAPNDMGKTPLGFACRYRNYDVVVELIARRADFCATNKLGDSCLHVSCLGGDGSVVQVLINCLREGGHHVEELVNSVNKRGETPLMLTCLMGHPEPVHLLANNGANMFLCDKYGNTCLHHACAGGNVDVIEVVLVNMKKKGNSVVELVNAVNIANESTISRACRYKYFDIVSLLLSSGADINITDDNGNSCLHHACESGDTSVVTALIESVSQKGESVIDFINTANNKKETPLIVACKYQYYHIAHVLLSYNADILERDELGGSCLHYVCSGGATSLAKVIIERVSTEWWTVEEFVNAVNRKNESSLLLACFFGRTEVAELLLAHGANVHLRDRFGNSCLHHACRWGDFNLVKAILDSAREKENLEAFNDVLNAYGESSLSLSLQHKHSNIHQLLNSYKAFTHS